jgi:hypothetical protein
VLVLCYRKRDILTLTFGVNEDFGGGKREGKGRKGNQSTYCVESKGF